MRGMLQMGVHQGTMHGMGSAKLPWDRSFPAPAYRIDTQFISQFAKTKATWPINWSVMLDVVWAGFRNPNGHLWGS